MSDARIVKAAIAFCDATRGGMLDERLKHIDTAIVHELFDATLPDAGTFGHLLAKIKSLLAGLELTNEEGEALILEVRIRMRRPS